VNAGDARVDYRMSDRSSLFARFSMAKRDYDDESPGNIFMGNGAAIATNNSESNNYNAVIGYTQTLGASKFFEFRAGYNRYWTHQFAEDFGIEKNNELGIPNGNLAAYPETSGLASFRPAGFASTGSPGTTNAIRVGTTYNLTGNLSWIRSNHNFKVGADARLVSGAVSNPQTQPQGRFTRPQLHEQRRRYRHRLLLRHHDARAAQPQCSATSWTPAAHQAELRRRVRAGRLPGSTASSPCSWAFAGTS
jgi:hypothetical protein